MTRSRTKQLSEFLPVTLTEFKQDTRESLGVGTHEFNTVNTDDEEKD